MGPNILFVHAFIHSFIQRVCSSFGEADIIFILNLFPLLHNMLPYINIRKLHYISSLRRFKYADAGTAFQYASSATGASVDERQRSTESCRLIDTMAEL